MQPLWEKLIFDSELLGALREFLKMEWIKPYIGWRQCVQSNFGAKRNLSITGVPVGIELKDTLNSGFNAPPKSRRQEGDGSIIVIVATDVPLLPHQLKRIVQRVPLGVGIVGGRGSNGSGRYFF
ncbi:MAG: P1 family peptidase [Cyclobacteriaceae bacterium]|nr:P1 family peptidase [Cyclobacteriaceae bacterium]